LGVTSILNRRTVLSATGGEEEATPMITLEKLEYPDADEEYDAGKVPKVIPADMMDVERRLRYSPPKYLQARR
jgi:hypothetical protein